MTTTATCKTPCDNRWMGTAGDYQLHLQVRCLHSACNTDSGVPASHHRLPSRRESGFSATDESSPDLLDNSRSFIGQRAESGKTISIISETMRILAVLLLVPSVIMAQTYPTGPSTVTEGSITTFDDPVVILVFVFWGFCACSLYLSAGMVLV
jgi:hypothetical protein